MSNTQQTHICRRCGRKLRSEESKQKGMGDTCYKKWQAEQNKKKLFRPALQKNVESV